MFNAAKTAAVRTLSTTTPSQISSSDLLKNTLGAFVTAAKAEAGAYSTAGSTVSSVFKEAGQQLSESGRVEASAYNFAPNKAA